MLTPLRNPQLQAVDSKGNIPEPTNFQFHNTYILPKAKKNPKSDSRPSLIEKSPHL